MLTQIEWWGGVVFVLGALVYRMVMGALEKKDQGVDWQRWLMRLFFVLPGVVLAGYFYPLDRVALQYAYLGVLGAALLVVVVMMVQEITGDASGDEDKPHANKAAKAEGEGEEEKRNQTEDEESGWLMTIVGAAVLYSPVLVACGLGCYKAWPMVQRLV